MTAVDRHSSLIDFISGFISLTEVDIQNVIDAFEPIRVSKNTILEEEGKLTRYLYFINSGFVRVFYIDNGEDRTTQINCPSRFITSFQSFIAGTKANDTLETITGAELLKISKVGLEGLNKKISEWRVFGEKIYEQALVFNEDRTRDMILLNAEERYLKMMTSQPDIIKNVPLQYIASYIGIKPESLSRIRRQLIS